MTNEQLSVIRFRVESLLATLRYEHSGATIHEVANIVQTGMALLSLIGPQSDYEESLRITRDLETKTVEFFKTKFAPTKKNEDC